MKQNTFYHDISLWQICYVEEQMIEQILSPVLRPKQNP